jgi:hypothetical protein
MITVATSFFIVGADPTGWSIENFSDEYLKHFILYEEPCYEDPPLLISDSHKPHTPIPAISIAKGNGIVMFTLLLHA